MSLAEKLAALTNPEPVLQPDPETEEQDLTAAKVEVLSRSVRPAGVEWEQS